MRGVLGAALIILGLAGAYLILTGRFPPSGASSATSSSGSSSTSASGSGSSMPTSGGPSASGGPGSGSGQGITITPHTAIGIPTMTSMSDQVAATGGIYA